MCNKCNSCNKCENKCTCNPCSNCEKELLVQSVTLAGNTLLVVYNDGSQTQTNLPTQTLPLHVSNVVLSNNTLTTTFSDGTTTTSNVSIPNSVVSVGYNNNILTMTFVDGTTSNVGIPFNPNAFVNATISGNIITYVRENGSTVNMTLPANASNSIIDVDLVDDIFTFTYSDNSTETIIIPIKHESFQVDVPVLTKNDFDGFIPLSDYDEVNEWIVDETNLSQYNLNNNAIINGFDDVFNKIFKLQGRAKIALEVDSGIVANKGGLALLDLTSTAVPIPAYSCKGVLTGRYTVLNGINLESHPITGEILMNPNSNKLLMYLSFVEYSNMNHEFGYISFNISYNY